MNERLRTTSTLAVLLANAARAGPPTVPVFEPDPMLHAPGGRIVFNRMCADEEPYRVHEALDAVPAQTRDKRPGWHGTAMITEGWGLDLRRPQHHGHRTRW